MRMIILFRRTRKQFRYLVCKTAARENIDLCKYVYQENTDNRNKAYLNEARDYRAVKSLIRDGRQQHKIQHRAPDAYRLFFDKRAIKYAKQNTDDEHADKNSDHPKIAQQIADGCDRE